MLIEKGVEVNGVAVARWARAGAQRELEVEAERVEDAQEQTGLRRRLAGLELVGSLPGDTGELGQLHWFIPRSVRRPRTTAARSRMGRIVMRSSLPPFGSKFIMASLGSRAHTLPYGGIAAWREGQLCPLLAGIIRITGSAFNSLTDAYTVDSGAFPIPPTCITTGVYGEPD